MALQPAAGARDLNPRQVENNRLLSEKLAAVYRQWGYDEVSPPRVERLDTLQAGGAIASGDVVRLVADEPLGLRPEMTASIARAACTRLASRPRPLRLWASGTVFQSRIADEGGLCIEENLQSGVELFGVVDITAEMELLSLLLRSIETLSLRASHQPRLLLGHTDLMDLILRSSPHEERSVVRTALIQYDRLTLESLALDQSEQTRLLDVLDCRGEPRSVLSQLRSHYGAQPVFESLERLVEQLDPLARDLGVTLQLDPTFQPHYELYTGLVFQLVCAGSSAPVVIARGGRYDDLVKRCGGSGDRAAGAGFSLAIDPIRELLSEVTPPATPEPAVFVAYSKKSSLESALKRQQHWHQQGRRALVSLEGFENREAAQTHADADGAAMQLDWLDP